MSDQYSYIAHLCERISSGGKKPSVALIKQKAERPVALKDIIEVLRRWQQNPDQFESAAFEPSEKADNNMDLQSQVNALESRVEDLEEQVRQLTRALNKIK